jgi:prepilin-type processing-associated H-X9-DG protein
LAGCREYGSYTFNGYLYNAAAPRILGGVEAPLPKQASSASQWYKSWYGIETPALIPFLGDGIWVNTWPEADDTPPFSREYLQKPHATYNAGMLRFCIDRHHRSVNMAFVDGHAESVPLNRLWELKWHSTFEVTSDVTIP